jgi:CHAT domain-containing protein
MARHRSEPASGYDAAALYWSERSKARTLLEALSEAYVDIREGVDAGLLERQRTLHQQIDSAARRQTALLSGKHSAEQAEAAGKELDSLLAQFHDLEGQIRAASPRYAALTQPEPLDLKQIRKQVLDPETALLEFSLGRDHSYVWVVTTTGIGSYELPGREDIETLARSTYELLTARNRQLVKETPEQRRMRIAAADAAYPEAAMKLSRTILAAAISNLSAKRLLVVTEGALQFVPFGALPSPSSDAEREPLAAGYEIVNVPSASTLALLRREAEGRQSAPNLLAVLADPVFDAGDPRIPAAHRSIAPNRADGPAVLSTVQREVERSARESSPTAEGPLFPRLLYSRQEAESISLFAAPEKCLEALDFRASRNTAMSPELAHYRIIHFATHTFIDNVHPELSGIVFSLIDERGRAQDGFLRLHEIYNLRLPAELVVLSACQTALGKQIKGEGMIGLTRGFIYAGAERVVASLWEVDDEATAALMKSFYERMLNGNLRAAAALRAAQMTVSQHKRWRSPYYWAGFVLQGEWK